MPKVAQSIKKIVSRCSAARASQFVQPSTTALQDIENTPPPQPRARRATRSQPVPPATPPSAELEKLRSELAALQDENSALRDTSVEQARQLVQTTSEVRSAKETLAKVRQAKRELSAQKRSLDDQLKEEQKRRARIKRDKRKQERKREEEHAELIEAQELRHTEESASMVSELRSLRAQNEKLSHDFGIACARVKRLQVSAAAHRRAKYALNKKLLRALRTMRRIRQGLAELRKRLTFDPKTGNRFSTKSRWISRRLAFYGVRPQHLRAAIADTASLFTITLRSPFMSRRTSGRVNSGESFSWTFLQLGRELKNSMGFICSSDGTTHKKITYEATAMSHAVPTYEPGVDDNDPSTWVNATRFVAVKEAVRHDAESQHQGKMALGKEMIEMYNRSPPAVSDGGEIPADAWSTKQLGQSKDHAADGVKEKGLAEAQKMHDLKARLGQEAYLADVGWESLLQAVVSLTEADVQDAIGKERDPAAVPWAERVNIADAVLKKTLGEKAYLEMQGQEKELNTLFIFGGCCSHKDLNAFKYGTDAIATLWKTETLATPSPPLLPNKSLHSILALGEKAGVDARLKAMDMSASGGPKLMALLGAIFRNKDDKKGYQHAGQALVQSFERELHGSDAISHANIADVNNTRFQSVGRAAVEFITYDVEYRRTIETICSAKTKAGANHMESGVLKAMDCVATLMDLIAMGIYMVCVSEPYMAAVHTNAADGSPPNLLDTVDLHRRVATFCEQVADDPRALFDDSAPLSSRTLDSKPIRNARFVSNTTVAFNACQRMQKNGTEKFIDKVITPALETWVIRNGRTIFAKQQVGEFRDRVAADYREKADTHDQQVAKKIAIEKERLERLAAVGIVTDVAVIEAMTLARLREQLEIHKDILKDPVLTDKKQFKWGMVKGLIPRRMTVLAALERYHSANPGVLEAVEKSVLLPSPMEVDGEQSSTPSDVEIYSEDDMMDDEFF
uniref:Uncharacterized protein n=1 Tax=Schizophyllum commune (strain H4-8 / FGSC 9210) TaxID=578458 RepID=D8PZV1_SCHCM